MSDNAIRTRAISELKSAIAEKRASIFVGSGISVASGLPSWSGLLAEMIDLVSSQPGNDPSLVSDAKLMLADKSKWLILAQLLRREMGNNFSDFIQQRFTDRAIKPNRIHESLVDIDWKTVVTTNYDRLIERAFIKKYGDDGDIPVFTYSSAPNIASSYCRGQKFILKAHGDAKEAPESVVLTEADYRQLVHREIGYQAILQTIFTTNSFLFVGCSLSDPDLNLLLGFLHSAFHGNTPLNYALLPENERHNAEDKVYYTDFKIHTITLDPSCREGDIRRFLDELK
jgi:hypothetical protein